MFGKRSLGQGKAKAKSKGKDSPKSPPVICTTPAKVISTVRIIIADPARLVIVPNRNREAGEAAPAWEPHYGVYLLQPQAQPPPQRD